MQLIGSLYIYSEAGGSAGPGGGQKAVGERLVAPREGSWRKLDKTSIVDDPFSKMNKLSFGNHFCDPSRSKV